MRRANMRATFQADRVMCSKRERVITGRVVPYGETGETNLGPTAFAAGSIGTPADPSRVKLLTDHNVEDPVAVGEAFWEHGTGLYASFRVPPGSRGDVALVEALTTRDGLSVGVEITGSDRSSDVLRITAGHLREVSMTALPAFDAARVTAVATKATEATEGADMAEAEITDTVDVLTATETQELVEASTKTLVEEFADVFNDRLDKVTAGTTGEPDPGRNLIAVAGDLLTAVRSRSALVVEAALAVTGTTDSAMQEKYVSTLVGTIDAGRPCVNSVSRADAGSDGMTFSVPHVTSAPTVAAHGEGTEVESTLLSVEWVSHDLKTYAGANVLTQQAIDRSSPETLGVLLTELATAYAATTELELATAAVDAADGILTTGIFLDDVAALGARIAENNGNLDVVWLGSEKWGDMLKTTVLDGPAYFSGQTALTNTFPGAVGALGGVTFVRSPALAPDALVGLDSSAVYWWEVAGSPFQLRTVQVSTLTQEIGIYGYGGSEIRRPAHLAKIDVGP